MATGMRLVGGACLVMLLAVAGTSYFLGESVHGQQAKRNSPPSTASNGPTSKSAAPPADDSAPRSPLLRALYDALDKVDDKDNEFGDRGELKKGLREADTTLDRIRRENARALKSVNRQTPISSQPNIVLVTLGQLPRDHLGSYGQKSIQTPNLDRLAARGARFTDFRLGAANASVRWALLTGRAAPQGEALALQPGDVTVAQALWRAGYTTAWIGDYSLGAANPPLSPADLGFDYWYGSHDPAIAYYPGQLWDGGRAVDVAENTADKRGRHINDLYSQQAANWVRQLGQGRAGRPFFLMVSYRIPAGNWQAPTVDVYEQQSWSPSAKAWASLVTGTDRGVGELLAALRDSNKLGNTVIVVTAEQRRDTVAGDEVFALDAATAEDAEAANAGARIPLIVFGPGRVSGALVADQAAATVDLAPTLAGLARFSRGRINYSGHALDQQFNPPPPQPVEPKVTEQPPPAAPDTKKPARKLPQIIRGRP